MGPPCELTSIHANHANFFPRWFTRLARALVTMVIQRIFDAFTPRFSNSKVEDKQLPIEHIRHTFHKALHDCKNMGAQRLIYKINVARTPSDLWLLRSDVHQCIAQTHSQSEAAERINALIPAFEGWLPTSQLKQI